jgi:ribosomal protein S12 methylthiotransferase accessory factor
LKNEGFRLKIIAKGGLFETLSRVDIELPGCQLTNGATFDGLLWISEFVPTRGEDLLQYQQIYTQGYPCLSLFPLDHSFISSYQKAEQGACPKCFLKRLQDNTSIVFSDLPLECSQIINPLFNFDLVVRLCLVPLIKLLFEPELALVSSARELNLNSFACREIPVLRDDLCDVCGEIQRTEQECLALNPVKLKSDRYRIRNTPSGDSLYQAFYDPKFGLVKDTSIELWHKYTLPVITFFGRNGFAGGHAFKLEESLALGFLESLERYSGFRRRSPVKRIFSTYHALEGEKINPETLGLLALPDHPENVEFTPFHKDLEMYWIEGFSHRTTDPVWIPECMVYYDPVGIEGLRLTPETSNGCALGAHPDEAFFFGLLELIERDAFSIIWYNQLPIQRIDPKTIDDDVFQFLLDKVYLENCSVFLFNMSLDITVPILMCICMRNDENLGAVTLGASAYPCSVKAARNSLIEATYFLSDFKNRTVTMEDELRVMAGDFGQVKDLSHHSYLYALPEMKQHLDFLIQRPICSFQEAASNWCSFPQTHNLSDDLEFLVSLIEQQGLDVFGVSYPCSELKPFGLYSYRAVVPGLVPISFGFFQRKGLGLARIFDVPEKLGFPKKRMEALNLVPHPFP